MEDARDGGREEPVGPVGKAQRGPHEQQLGQGLGMERQDDLCRDRLVGRRRVARAGTRDEGRAGIGDDPQGECQPRRGLPVPGQAELREAGRRRCPGRRADLGRGQQVSERIEVVPHSDAALRAGLQWRGAASRERIEDHITRPRIARDEGVREGGREAREVGTHRVERVAPQALLRLPFGRERDRRQVERELQGELTQVGRARWCAVRSGRHRRVETSLSRHADTVVGAMGRGV